MIVVTGCLGYVGRVLCEELDKVGVDYKGIDAGWFYDASSQGAPGGEVTISDIRQIDLSYFSDATVLVHLANIANDPAVDLNSDLSWDVNVLWLQSLLSSGWLKKDCRIIYASSGSVYGVATNVMGQVEGDMLIPISTYNKTKMVAERILLSYANEYPEQFIVRPATVCGYSPRMRFDVSVNMLTEQAVQSGIINVYGGSQMRPHVHIDDCVSFYLKLIFGTDVEPGIYNLGFQNITISELAIEIQKHVNCEIITAPGGNDPRSYAIDSSKALGTGYAPLKTVEDAIKELSQCIEAGSIAKTNLTMTIDRMKLLGLGQ